MDATNCLACGRALPKLERGRPQRFCSDKCRKACSRRLNGQRQGTQPPTPILAQPEPKHAPERPPHALGTATNLRRRHFHWHGLDLHLGRGKTPVLTLVADADYPHLFRIRYPDGWTSTPANLSRAKDAAYGHAWSCLQLREAA